MDQELDGTGEDNLKDPYQPGTSTLSDKIGGMCECTKVLREARHP